MTTKTTVSITEARKRIFDIAEQVQRPNVYYTLTDKGRPKAVVMSAEEFESWAETLEVMRDFPNLSEDLKEIERDIRSGKYKTYTRLEDLLHVPSKLKAKRRKKSR
ncbi:MAG: type II toxin-antitoxin system Phd/YefM family antitoxin [Candidatus Kerfeldbacteria bacterium]|nr:type II toxin-antitoxin system Phd/YefM family antitoxin [Candidatus Kerfeldbacteria bacterium]